MKRHVKQLTLSWPSNETPNRDAMSRMLIKIDMMNAQNQRDRRCIIRTVWFKPGVVEQLAGKGN